MGAKLYLRVYDGDQIVMDGTAKEIANALLISESSVTSSARNNSRLLWKYRVEVIGPALKVKPKPNKHNTKLEWIYRNLYYIGNSFLREDPQGYVDELKEKGISIKWEKCSDGIGYHLERIYD